MPAALWPLDRSPYLLETSRPGMFAGADVRCGNIKRDASSAGEGSIAISCVHRVLAETSRSTSTANMFSWLVGRQGDRKIIGMAAAPSNEASRVNHRLLLLADQPCRRHTAGGVPARIAVVLPRTGGLTSHRRDVMSTRRRLIDTRSWTGHGNRRDHVCLFRGIPEGATMHRRWPHPCTDAGRKGQRQLAG
jgi:hypothetical protein